MGITGGCQRGWDGATQVLSGGAQVRLRVGGRVCDWGEHTSFAFAVVAAPENAGVSGAESGRGARYRRRVQPRWDARTAGVATRGRDLPLGGNGGRGPVSEMRRIGVR